jgi:hypothetical protein
MLAAGLAAVTAGLAACGPAAETSGSAGAARLESLERRASLVRDADDIKRLQRAYGYYVDEGMWDEAAALFADDGSIEIGLDGVYIGRERIRAYLFFLGGGRMGLPPGRLNEHMQLMPVVTVAPDGLSAKARWRELLMVGTYGESAAWGEGPMENEYVKVDGVWRIQSLHWYQNLFVPYETGWLSTPDPTGGVHVAGVFPPDRPPSEVYETWPGVYLPAFHFPNPVLDPEPRVAEDAAPPSGPAPSVGDPARRAGALERTVARLEDQDEVENLQRIFGFYFDEALWSEAADLFAEGATVELGGRGVYVGRERIRAFFRTLGDEGPRDGRLYDHMQLQPVVHVAPDGRTAKGRWRLFSQVAEHGAYARWGAGVYENEYVEEDGVWKIASLRLYETMTTPYEHGWAVLAVPAAGPSETLPPDRPPTVDYAPYPAAFTPPFHYDNPVTGRRDEPAPVMDAPALDEAALAAALDELEDRVTRLEDVERIERLEAIRAYYLAHSQWDDLAALFAEDGAIEIALRGAYVGPESVRRSLDLYTEPGIQDGLLHNHMQYQTVIHLGSDGRTANLRSRAFSIMGQFEGYANWMGGVYENELVKGEDGVWRYSLDRQINTYFAAYAQGWRDLAQRPPPGISQTIPPDRPPTSQFVMYPSAFIPAFHYPNPVTGRTYDGPFTDEAE